MVCTVIAIHITVQPAHDGWMERATDLRLCLVLTEMSQSWMCHTSRVQWHQI